MPVAGAAELDIDATAAERMECTWIPPPVAVRSTQGTSERTAVQVLALSEMRLARGLLTLFTLLAHVAGHPL